VILLFDVERIRGFQIIIVFIITNQLSKLLHHRNHVYQTMLFLMTVTW